MTTPQTPRQSVSFIRLIRNSDVWGVYKEQDEDGGESGRIFYHNSETRISSWKPPRLSLELRRQNSVVEMRRQKKERQEGEEEEKKRRRETNYEEKKIVMRVGERRLRGKGSEILDQLSVCGAGSVLREKNVSSGSLLRVRPSLKIRPRSHALTSFEQLSPTTESSPIRVESVLQENTSSDSLLRVRPSIKIRPRSHALTSFDQLSPTSPTSSTPTREDSVPVLRSKPPLPPPSKDMRRSLWARDWSLSFEENQTKD